MLNQSKPYFGVALLLCVALFIASCIGAVGDRINNYRESRSRRKRLHRLTSEEKQLLRTYIERQTRSINLNVTSGVVNGLEQETVIYRSSNVGHLEP
jgi:hypothetical protein